MQVNDNRDIDGAVVSKSLLLTDSRTSASAVGDRGVMIHLKGTGCLLRRSDFSSRLLLYHDVIFLTLVSDE